MLKSLPYPIPYLSCIAQPICSKRWKSQHTWGCRGGGITHLSVPSHQKLSSHSRCATLRLLLWFSGVHASRTLTFCIQNPSANITWEPSYSTLKVQHLGVWVFLIIHVHLTPQLWGAETSACPHVGQYLSSSGFLPAMGEWSLKFGCCQTPQEQTFPVHLAILLFIS